MSPSTIIFTLLGLGFVVLLVAPRLHRRSNARSLADAERQRSDRITKMRGSPTSAEVTVGSKGLAVRARDVLLLRGVRTEILVVPDEVVLLTTNAERSVVESVVDELSES